MNEQSLAVNKLFEDVFDGKIPARVPIMTNIDSAFCLDYAGFDLKKEQYSLSKTIEAIDITTRDIDADTTIGVALRFPQLYKTLGAQNFQMDSNGFIQHPEVQGMHEEDYDAFIADPMKTLWDTILPRIYKNLNAPGFEGKKVLAKAFFTFATTMGGVAQAYKDIAEKYGRSTYTIAFAASAEPLDTLSDQLRSFSGISTDIRRRPEKVAAACEALVPLCLKAGLSPESSRYNRIFIPLHMAPYMRPKDFEKLYWPTFKAYVDGLDEAGAKANLFVEHDWMRYLDYFNELPEGTMMVFEYGDPKEIKEKIGKRHIISGLYPVGLLKSGTKQECIDKAKELIDILAPDGHYVFNFDKAILRMSDVNVENLKAVFAFVQEYGVYH